MANVLTATQMETWERTTQALLEEGSIAMDLANVRDMNGQWTLHNPYDIRMQSGTYTAYNDVTDQDINYVDDTLTTFTSRIVSFVYDPVSQMDTEYDVAMSQTRNAAYVLGLDIERDFFAEYSNATHASSSTITLGSSNVVTTFGNAKAALTNTGVNPNDIVVVVDDFQSVKIADYVVTNGFTMADESIRRGLQGKLVNMPMYTSSSLIAEGSLTPADNFSADETVTINGVTFTFKAVPSAAGEVDIGASTAVSIDNLVAAVNNSAGYAPWAGSATAYFEVTAANRELLNGVVATDGTTTMDITTRGYRAVSSSSNEWGAITLNALVMSKRAVDFAFKEKVKLYTQPVHKQLGTRYMTHVRYGIKTFAQGAKKMYNLKLLAQAAGA